MDALIQGCRKNIWHATIGESEFLGDAPTMLSPGERKMLHWLAREIPMAPGDSIIDAGCFLGGSTMGLATGLDNNPTKGGTRIHSFDMFRTPNDGYSQGMIGNSRFPGQTVLDLYVLKVSKYVHMLAIYAGDLIDFAAPKGKYPILFIDIAKTRELNSKIVTDFFPNLVPGRSIVVQQDYNDHSCQWINASMEILEPCFEWLCDEGSSRVYVNTQRVPDHLLKEVADMGPRQEMELLERAVAKEHVQVSAYFTAIGRAWSVFEADGLEAALSYTAELPPQPWPGERYADIVEGALVWLGNAGALDKYHADYFKPAPT